MVPFKNTVWICMWMWCSPCVESRGMLWVHPPLGFCTVVRIKLRSLGLHRWLWPAEPYSRVGFCVLTEVWSVKSLELKLGNSYLLWVLERSCPLQEESALLNLSIFPSLSMFWEGSHVAQVGLGLAMLSGWIPCARIKDACYLCKVDGVILHLLHNPKWDRDLSLRKH